jgi:hypothetical protein
MPDSFRALSVLASCCTTTGANPSDNSSMIKDFGIGHEAARDRQHLLLAAGKSAGLLSSAFFQPRKQRVDVIEPLGEAAPRALGEGAHLQVVLHAHRVEQLAPFRHQHQSAPGLGVRSELGDIFAGEEHPAAEWLDVSGNGAQARRFSGAIGADQRRHGAWRHAERNPPEDLDLVIARLEGLYAQQRLAHFETSAL